MKRILIMAVLVGLGIFLSLQVAQARGDDISISEDDKMYMTPEQISSYESGSTQADVQSVSEPSPSYEARTDYSQPDISSGRYDYSPADTGATQADSYQPSIDISSSAQIDNNIGISEDDRMYITPEQTSSFDRPSDVNIGSTTSHAEGGVEFGTEVVIPAQSNSDRIQEILDSRAQAREERANFGRERSFANDNVISEPVQSSAINSHPAIESAVTPIQDYSTPVAASEASVVRVHADPEVNHIMDAYQRGGNKAVDNYITNQAFNDYNNSNFDAHRFDSAIDSLKNVNPSAADAAQDSANNLDTMHDFWSDRMFPSGNNAFSWQR